MKEEATITQPKRWKSKRIVCVRTRANAGEAKQNARVERCAGSKRANRSQKQLFVMLFVACTFPMDKD